MSGSRVVHPKASASILFATLLVMTAFAGPGNAEDQNESTDFPDSLETVISQAEQRERLSSQSPRIAVDSADPFPDTMEDERRPFDHPVDPEELVPPVIPERPAAREQDPLVGPTPTDNEDCVAHPAIEITENEGPKGFVLAQDDTTGIAVYRPGSGVTSGMGTKEDPYIIEGWCLEEGLPLPAIPYGGIRIEHTDAHVVIRGVVIADYWGPGVDLFEADHVTLENNVMRDVDIGVNAVRTSGLTIRDSTVLEPWYDAVFLEDTQSTRVLNNTLQSGWTGIYGMGNSDLVVKDNIIENALEINLYLTGGHGLEITGNILLGAYYGFWLSEVDQVVMRNNMIETHFYPGGTQDLKNTTLEGNTFNGHGDLIFYDFWSLAVHNNQFTQSGFRGVDGDHLVVTGNRIEDASRGIYTNRVNDTRIEDNTIEKSHWSAVHSQNGDNTNVMGNELRDNPVGIDMRGLFYQGTSKNITVTENLIEGPGVGSGIRVSNIEGIRVSQNEIQGHMEGIRATSIHGGVIDDNQLTDNGWLGIYVSSTKPVSISRNDLNNQTMGIYLEQVAPQDFPQPPIPTQSTSDPSLPAMHTVVGNNLLDNGDFGIQLVGLWGADVSHNELGSPRAAQIQFSMSRDLIIEDNQLSSSPNDWPVGQFDRISLWESENATIRGNTLSEGGLILDGSELAHFDHTIDDSNIAGGKPILYLHGDEGAVVTQDVAQVILVGSHGTEVTGLALKDTPVGVLIAQSDDVRVHNTSFEGTDVGVFAFASDRLRLTDIHVEGPGWAGFLLLDTVDGTLEGNEIGNISVAAAALGAYGLNIVDNTVNDAESTGVWVSDARGTRISGNRIHDTEVGVYLSDSRDAVIEENRLTDSFAGVAIQQSRAVTVDHSDLVQNTVGLVLLDSRDTLHRFNEISGNAYGIALVGSGDGGGHEAHENNIHGNDEEGLLSLVDAAVDARDNWWGCSVGPGAGDCDAVEGNVDFTPWRTGPVAGAGVT